MTIRLKTVCSEFLGQLPDGEYAVPDGCDAFGALRACMEAAGLSLLPEDQDMKLIFMRNGRHVKPSETLCAGDRLTVLRPLLGG